MDRVNGNNPVDIGDGRRGFRSQNAAAGVAGTEVTAKYLNDVQEEICAVIENAGLVLDPGNQQQLWEALQSVAAPGFANRAAWLPVLSIITTAPPNGAIIGDTYIIPAGATGAWAGNQQKLAEWTGSKWRIVNTKDGHGVSLPDGRVFEKIGGTYIEKIAIDAQSGKWNFAQAGGTANALTATMIPAPTALTAGLSLRIKVNVTNTGAATLNVNGLGAKPIVRFGGFALKPGDLPAGGIAELIFNSANNSWQLIAIPNGAGSISSYSVAGTYSFVVPNGIFNIKRVRLWGGGGGGGGCSSSSATGAGGGAGSGAYGEKIDIPVNSGDEIVITVGAGGAAGAVGNTGGNGGTTSFGSYLAVLGGAGAGGSTGGIAPRGLGASAPTGADIAVSGNDGSEGIQIGSTYLAGVGAGAPLGSGITAHRIITSGRPGLFPGGGGGGAAGSTAIGGVGAPGFIIVEY